MDGFERRGRIDVVTTKESGIFSTSKQETGFFMLPEKFLFG
ncbi:MAG: hypothetical protein ACTSUE_26035 [Promethearchaeota archaeon]